MDNPYERMENGEGKGDCDRRGPLNCNGELTSSLISACYEAAVNFGGWVGFIDVGETVKDSVKNRGRAGPGC